MDLLYLCLTPTYFQYNVKHYKQLYGTVMGSPVSVVVAKIVMQNAEEQALVTYSETLPLWLRYIDDTITAVHESKIDEFYEHLNRQNTSIQFTTEIEENGKIPFLDCLVTRRNNTLTEPLSAGKLHTLTDYLTKRLTILLHNCSNLDEKSTIFLRLDDRLTDETKTLNSIFSKNNYSTDFIERDTDVSPNGSSNNSYTTTATIL